MSKIYILPTRNAAIKGIVFINLSILKTAEERLDSGFPLYV